MKVIGCTRQQAGEALEGCLNLLNLPSSEPKTAGAILARKNWLNQREADAIADLLVALEDAERGVPCPSA